MTAVRSIDQERWVIRRQHCECGSAYDHRPEIQRLEFRESGPVDILVVPCSSCGRRREFVFDIAAFYGRPDILSFKNVCQDEKALWEMFISHELRMEATLQYFKDLAASGDVLALEYLEDGLRAIRAHCQVVTNSSSRK